METENIMDLTLKKCVYTLCVDNYFPELCELTIPNHEAYAKKIGADFKLITERKYPEWPATYEKVQIYEQGVNYDWNIHIDADMLIHPDLHDITKPDLTKIYYYSIYDPRLYFPPNLYFLRDGRLVGVCSAFIAVPNWCHDLWEPFSMTFEQAKEGLKSVHGIDDYCFSINFAKYGLKGDFIFEGDTPPLWQVQHLGVDGDSKGKEESILENAKNILKSWQDFKKE
jgi:hypothetical protein